MFVISIIVIFLYFRDSESSIVFFIFKFMRLKVKNKLDIKFGVFDLIL